ncbi:MAG: DegT/DnrJ/EryC1/StrS family aminotransferase, partial [Bacteriovoracaceae bacterium]|nr:DegT/DnrJ/EryC1/StrS family aminotransferase [Bacteriovoracaceae bacterium]
EGIGRGDEVLVPAQTFIATWLAVTRVGATPIPVDVELATGLLDLNLLDEAITPRTRACLVVHLFGRMPAMDKLSAWAKKNKILLIEDAAQAHGAKSLNRHAGEWGDAAGFSFYPTKNLGALGDGGAIATNDIHLARRVRLLRNYGSENKYEHLLPGANSRLDELQAAFLNIKLSRFDHHLEERKRLSNKYIKAFSEISELELLPKDTKKEESAWHLFPLRTQDRNSLKSFLEKRNIGCGIHYPQAPFQSKVYENEITGSFPNAEQWSKTELSLPLFIGMTSEQQYYVIEAVKEFFESAPLFKDQSQIKTTIRKSPSRAG